MRKRGATVIGRGNTEQGNVMRTRMRMTRGGRESHSSVDEKIHGCSEKCS